MRDVCIQVDDKITLCVFLILTAWSFQQYIFPSVERFYSKEYPELYGIFSPAVSMSKSFIDTLGIGSVVFLVVIRWVQGIQTGYKIWSGTVLIIGIAAFLADKAPKIKFYMKKIFKNRRKK